MKKLTVIVVMFVVCRTMLAASFGAHTFHTTLTRMDYNAADKNIEISIQIFTHDLVPALEKQNHKEIDLERTANADELIKKYLETHFVLKDKKGEIKKIVWVGKEMQTETTYLYIEIPSDEDFENYTLVNSMFFKSFPEQTNLIIVRNADKKGDLLFKNGDKAKEIAYKN